MKSRTLDLHRVIWQYDQTVIGDLYATSIPDDAEVLAKHPLLFDGIELVGHPEHLFLEPALTLRAGLIKTPEDHRENPIYDFAGYYHAFTTTFEEAVRLRDRLRNTSGVREANVQDYWEQPVRLGHYTKKATETIFKKLSLYPEPTMNLMGRQTYLNAAPTGVDAHFAWKRPGGRGDGIRIVDIEDGWNFGHEDLIERQAGVIFGQNSDDDHGTAVLGVYSGDQNEYGVIGIASDAIASASSVLIPNHPGWNPEAAIKYAADHLHPGDVMLLEMHFSGPNSDPEDDSQRGYVPTEYWNVGFAAVEYAVNKGIYVVEAAGNGSENLDSRVYKGVFDRDIRDSGAIMVGAGASDKSKNPRARLWFSNYGSRLDVQAWGENVVTTGGRTEAKYHNLIDHEDRNRCYTQSFGGTSSASAIIAGVVAVISGCVKAADRPPLSPLAMRQLLVETGSPQADIPQYPASKHIGPLPDLRKALERLELA
ncbi:MAG: S8 family peptidase [Chloroflexota bacterium]